MLSQWERGLSDIAAGGGSADLNPMQQMTAAGLRMQEATAEMIAKSLQALNLPSRTELLALQERLDRIEAALDRLASVKPPSDH